VVKNKHGPFQKLSARIPQDPESLCPMEGFDECRVKKILGLGGESSIVMVISIGRQNPEGIFGPRLRLDPKLFLFEV